MLFVIAGMVEEIDMVRDVTPFVGGFKGLPAHMDNFKIKALMKEEGLTRKQAIKKLKETNV